MKPLATLALGLAGLMAGRRRRACPVVRRHDAGVRTVLVPSGTVVSTGPQDNIAKRAPLTAIQVSYGWRPDRADLFSYDAGGEYRRPRRVIDRRTLPVTTRTFEELCMPGNAKTSRKPLPAEASGQLSELGHPGCRRCLAGGPRYREASRLTRICLTPGNPLRIRSDGRDPLRRPALAADATSPVAACGEPLVAQPGRRRVTERAGGDGTGRQVRRHGVNVALFVVLVFSAAAFSAAACSLARVASRAGASRASIVTAAACAFLAAASSGTDRITNVKPPA